MDIHARIISNDNELTPEFRGLYGARFYTDYDPENPNNRVIKILTSNTTHNVNSTTNIGGNAIASSPSSFVFEMRYYFEPIWYYRPKYWAIEFCNKANARMFSLGFFVSSDQPNTDAKKLSIKADGLEADEITLCANRWYKLRFEYYHNIDQLKESKLKLFIYSNQEKTVTRDIQINAGGELPTRALLIHSATNIKGVQYLDDISFTLTDRSYSSGNEPCKISEELIDLYTFNDGIPSDRDFYVDMRLKKIDDFLTMDPAAWNTAQGTSGIKHTHDFYEVMLVQTGEAVFLTEKSEYPIYEGSIVIVPPGVKHGIISEHKYNIISITGNFEKLSRFDDATVLYDNIYGEGKKLAELALYNRFGKEEYFTSLCDSYINFILLNLDYPKSDMAAIVYAMMDNIKKNFDNSELSVVKLLKESGYAKDYVRTKFFEIAKMTPKKYLTTIRMKKAKELLSLYGDDVSISKIAEQCGIVDPAVFSKNFKQYYGISPKQYIKKRGTE